MSIGRADDIGPGPEFFNAVRPVLDNMYTATVDIFQTTGKPHYNYETGERDDTEQSVPFATGVRCRIQQISDGGKFSTLYNPTTQMLFRVECIPEDVPAGLQLSFKMKVTSVDRPKQVLGTVFDMVAFGGSSFEQYVDIIGRCDLSQLGKDLNG